MVRAMKRGLTLLDLLVALAFLALLVYLVRLDWTPPHVPVP
jgi:type II secretory pathway component PulJ